MKERTCSQTPKKDIFLAQVKSRTKCMSFVKYQTVLFTFLIEQLNNEKLELINNV